MNENTKIIIMFELSSETYAHAMRVENLHDLMRRAAEKVLYECVLTDI